MAVEIQFYDKLYEDVPYEEQALEIQEFINKYSPNAKSLLDIACGTGQHLEVWEKTYDCVGIDASQMQIDRCRDRIESPVHLCEMHDFDLGRKFDAIVVMFGSVALAGDYEKYKETIANIKKHLNPDGVVLIEAFLFSEQFDCGSIRNTTKIRTVEGEDIEVRSTISREGDECVLDKEYLVRDEHHTDQIRLLLMTLEQYKEPFREQGFRSEINRLETGHYGHLYALKLD